MNSLFKFLLYTMWFTLGILFFTILFIDKTHAEGNQIIWCIRLSDNYTRKPNDQGNCLLGKNWMNIIAPTEDQMKELLKIHGNKAKVINRLPIYNAESGFNNSAVWVHKNGKDCGIIQIRDIYGGCKMTEEQQMKWLETRISKQLSDGSCKKYKDSSEERKMRCVYARHRWDKSGYAVYPSKLAAMRLFYINYYK